MTWLWLWISKIVAWIVTRYAYLCIYCRPLPLQPFRSINLRIESGISLSFSKPLSVSQWDGTPLCHPSLKPSTSSSQLWRLQQVNQALLTTSVLWSRMPDFKILQRPLSIPNVVSTSFLNDSSHWEKQSSLRFAEFLYGGTVDHCKYLLSTIT